VAGKAFDLDNDVRNELVRDARVVCAQLKQSVDFILVTGDIAYFGIEQEYKIANDWLIDLCKKVGCSPGKIFVIPGNHDIDWKVIERSAALRHVQTGIRKAGAEALDKQIADALGDPETASMLFRPLSAYNDFASSFECTCGPDNVWWSNDHELGHGFSLRLLGLTSILWCQALRIRKGT